MALEAILAVEQAEQDAARKKAEAAQKAKEIAAKADREGTAAVKEAAERAAAELWTLAKSAEEKRKDPGSGARGDGFSAQSRGGPSGRGGRPDRGKDRERINEHCSHEKAPAHRRSFPEGRTAA